MILFDTFHVVYYGTMLLTGLAVLVHISKPPMMEVVMNAIVAGYIAIVFLLAAGCLEFIYTTKVI